MTGTASPASSLSMRDLLGIKQGGEEDPHKEREKTAYVPISNDGHRKMC